jgi:hypothetical protein
MEEDGWKKDEKPYVVFRCSKCKQYLYVKITQKTKKCLRCGRQHKVTSIIDSGEIVKGMTKAVEAVQTRQHELAIKELGTTPEFRTAADFTIKRKPKIIIDIDTYDDDTSFSSRFTKMLQEISSSYSYFPYYVFEVMAENFNIPDSEVKILVNTFLKKGILVRQGSSYKIQF